MTTNGRPRKKHNYLVDYQIVPEDETETFIDFVDLLSMYDNVDRPKYGLCKGGDATTFFHELKNRGFVFEGVPAEPVRHAPLGPYSLDSKEDYKFHDIFERLKQKYKNDDRKTYGVCSKYGAPDRLFNKDADKARIVDENGDVALREMPEDWTKGYKDLVERIRNAKNSVKFKSYRETQSANINVFDENVRVTGRGVKIPNVTSEEMKLQEKAERLPK
ncbi:unnamed protein product [Oikopleura dioica]|uniref:Uncharacterized protein n=1 Tax=Oikopleura dioica TaxID=34765 RepID=E4YDC1_OIKDI|nr:unnamed protein product [Oikopleura dioica]